MKRIHYLTLLFALTVIPRLISLFILGPGITHDSTEYLSIAHNVVNNGKYAISLELHDSLAVSNDLIETILKEKKFPEAFTENNPPRLTMFRSPGYPLFVSLCMFILPQNIYSVAIMQILLIGIMAVLLFQIINKLTSHFDTKPRKHLIIFIAILIGFSFPPGLVIFNSFIMREIFEICLFIMIIYLWQRSDKWINVVLMGILLGWLYLTLQYFTLLIYGFIFWLIIETIVNLIRKENIIAFWKKYINIRILAAFIISFLVFNAWCYRNQQRFGAWEISSFTPGTVLVFKTLMLDDKLDESYKLVNIDKFRTKYPTDNTTVNAFFENALTRKDDLDIWKVKRSVYVADDKYLLSIDSDMKEYATSILMQYPIEKIITHVLSNVYSTLRVEYYLSFKEDKYSQYVFRAPSVVQEIKEGRFGFFEIFYLAQWLFFLTIILIFFLLGVPAYVKAIFMIYLVPYMTSTFVEPRVTLIHWVFISIAIGYTSLMLYHNSGEGFLKTIKKSLVVFR